MQIKILGSGCKKCIALEANARTALATTGKQAEIVKVTDIVQIAAHGVMSTPALVINEQVISSGKVLSPNEIEGILARY